MAIANYITTGTYSTVEFVNFSSESQTLAFLLVVYSDSSKTDKIAEKTFDFMMKEKKESLLGVEQTTPPQNPTPGDKYIIASTGAIGEWADYPNKIATWREHSGGCWTYEQPSVGTIYYDEITTSYVKITQNGYITRNNLPDSRVWELFFNKNAIFNTPGNNLHTQIYKLLKTQKGFELTVDT